MSWQFRKLFYLNFFSACHHQKNSLIFSVLEHTTFTLPKLLKILCFLNWFLNLCVMLPLEILYEDTRIICFLWSQPCNPTYKIAFLQWSLHGKIIGIRNTHGWRLYTQEYVLSFFAFVKISYVGDQNWCDTYHNWWQERFLVLYLSTFNESMYYPALCLFVVKH